MKVQKDFSRLAGPVLWTVLVVYFGLICLLTIYNHPGTDDYRLLSAVAKHGFWGYDRYMYFNWSGRFFSMFIGKLAVAGDLLLCCYWLHTPVLLLLNACSAFVLFKAINKYLVRLVVSRSELVLISLCYLAVQISCIPEIYSAYYWFSGAVSYQPAVIMLQLELAVLIIFLGNKKALAKYVAGLATCLLVILINLTNEVSVLVNGVTLSIIVSFFASRKMRSFFLLVSACYLISALIMATAPGNFRRAASIPPGGLLQTLAVAGARTAITFWTLFKNPAFLAAATAAFFAGGQVPAVLPATRFIPKITATPLRILLVAVACIMVVMVPIMYVSNGSFPERANNEVVQFLLILILPLIYLWGASVASWSGTLSIRKIFVPVMAILIVCNPSPAELVKSYAAAGIHDQVLSQRRQMILTAVKAGETQISLPSYEQHRDSLVNLRYPRERQQLRDLIRRRPTALMQEDDLDTDASLAPMMIYFGLDSIHVRR